MKPNLPTRYGESPPVISDEYRARLSELLNRRPELHDIGMALYQAFKENA